jgi:predicted nucleic acid-binding protein
LIIADTGAVVALIDADDRHHGQLRELFEADPSAWLLPWAILPEVDYLVLSHLGAQVEAAFLDDLAEGRYAVEWGQPEDLERANELSSRYASLGLGVTDAVVMAVAERLGAGQIATLDERDFGAVELACAPALIPRDLDSL